MKIQLIIIITGLFGLKAYSQHDTIFDFANKCQKDSVLMNWAVNQEINRKNNLELSVRNLRILVDQAESKSVRTKVLNYFLGLARFPGIDVESPIILCFVRDDFDDKAKIRLLELLYGKYSLDEYKIYQNYQKTTLNNVLSENFVNFYSYRAKLAVDKTGKTYKEVKDSIINFEIENQIRYKDTVEYSGKLIWLAGWLDLQGAVPIIEQQIVNEMNNSLYPNNQAKLALARLGNLEYENFFFAEFEKTKRDLSTLLYICSSKTVEVLETGLYSEELSNITGSDGVVYAEYKRSLYYICVIESIILNFPYKYTKRIDQSICSDAEADKIFQNEVIENTKKWMNENKGKYILNRNYCIPVYLK